MSTEQDLPTGVPGFYKHVIFGITKGKIGLDKALVRAEKIRGTLKPDQKDDFFKWAAHTCILGARCLESEKMRAEGFTPDMAMNLLKVTIFLGEKGANLFPPDWATILSALQRAPDNEGGHASWLDRANKAMRAQSERQQGRAPSPDPGLN